MSWFWNGRGMVCGRWRRKKSRFIDFQSSIETFKPVWIPLSKLDKVVLQQDELESLRLKNIEWMDIIQWAEKMWISKSTFARIYNEAVAKITDALINGKAINIEQ